MIEFLVLSLAKPHTHSSTINTLITEVASPISLVVSWRSPHPISCCFLFVANKLIMMMMMMMMMMMIMSNAEQRAKLH